MGLKRPCKRRNDGACGDLGYRNRALIIHGRHDAIRYFIARGTWIAFGKNTLLSIALFGGFVLVLLVAVNTPWLTIGSFLAALLAIIPMSFQAAWNWFTDRSLSEQLLIIAVVMTWLIVATIRRAADRIIEANRRRHHEE